MSQTLTGELTGFVTFRIRPGDSHSLTAVTLTNDITLRVVGVMQEIQESIRKVIPPAERSKLALDTAVELARDSRPRRPAALRARHGHHQMCRLPCYRGARAR